MFKWFMAVTLGLLLSSYQTLRAGNEPDESRVETSQDGESQSLRRKMAFPADEYAQLAKRGDSTLEGRLTLRIPSGETVAGGSETVSIAPVTRYSTEEAEAIRAGLTIEPADPRAREHTHYTETDEAGHFVAQGLPAGDYYVAGAISLPGCNLQRAIIVQQIRIASGCTTTIELQRSPGLA